MAQELPFDETDTGQHVEYEVESPNITLYNPLPQVHIVEEDTNTSMLQVEVEDSSTVRLERNEHGHTTLHLASARVVESVADIIENNTASEAVVLLRDKTPVEGWTSLHISTLRNKSDIVSYILDKVSDEQQRRQFIDEVDNVGWTSLQWGATLDQTEAVEKTIDHMAADHQLEVMTSSWTLLHATAQTDAVKTMKNLMEKVEVSGEDKWNILRCPTSSGQTALHIAVAEGHTRAAIMLLDLAGSNRSRLLSQTDHNEMVAENYTSQFPLLGEYLSLATTFNEPGLHAAACRNDKYLISWILDSFSGEELDKINERDSAGLTVLHTAAEANSSDVIKEISKILGPRNFMLSLRELTNDGKTALHLAVMNQHSSAVHSLLCTLNKDNRREMLTSKYGDENAIEVAKKRKYQEVVDILEFTLMTPDEISASENSLSVLLEFSPHPFLSVVIFSNHKLILSDGLSTFFKKLNHSLYSFDLPKERVKIRYKRLEQCIREDRGFVRHVNMDAATCILYKDVNMGGDLVREAVKVDGDNIHTWCNKGVLALLKEQEDAAEQAAFRILELIAEQPAVCLLRAKIDYAYWLAESLRTEQARDKSCELLTECGPQARGSMQEYLSYYLVKILVRHIRSDDKYDKPNEWISGKLNMAVEQLIILSKSVNKEYRVDMWLWLAELQCTNISRQHLVEPLETFCRETEIETVDLESCLNYAVELDNELGHERKIRARIAKNCLDCAYDCSERNKLHWFKKAVELSEKWMDDNYWLFMCASTSAQGLLHIWAIKIYSQHGNLVREQYRQLFGRDIDSQKRTIDYVARYFYHENISSVSEDCTVSYHERIRQHLKEILRHDDGWISHGLKYARTEFLLGSPRNEVENAFKKAITASESKVRQARAWEHFGCYYLATKRYELARDAFNMAVSLSENYYQANVAKGGLSFIKLCND